MRDIPIFTAANGIASLILREIPLRAEAYVWIRSVFGATQELLRECEDFCRAAGAERVYFGGNAELSAYPVYASLCEREIAFERLPKTKAVLQAADATWVNRYNLCFSKVPAARSFEQTPPDAYDIFEQGERIGLGQINGDRIAAVASLRRGCGQSCVSALAAQTGAKRVRLLCAQENLPAMRLYDRLGFSPGELREIWYTLSY